MLSKESSTAIADTGKVPIMKVRVESHRVRVWDLPTRVFHWALAALVLVLFLTAKLGGDAMVWHARAGLAAGAMLSFRVLWGFAGGRWSRFASFSCSPRRLAAFVSGKDGANVPVGHSPLAALSVYAMLAALLAQVGTGLFSENKDEFAGPLNSFVSSRTAHALTIYHHEVGQPLLVVLVTLHLAAIAWYLMGRRRNLTAAMWHGDKWPVDDAPGSRDDMRTRLLALGLFACCAALAAWVSQLGG